MHVCPACGKGYMFIVEILGELPADPSEGPHRGPTSEADSKEPFGNNLSNSA
jgi:hypothetical protein